MGYLLFYMTMLLLGWYSIKKFDFNKREMIELLSLPIAIPMIGIALVTLLTNISTDTILGLIFFPLLIAFIVGIAYPLLLIPVLLILWIKKEYRAKPITFFFLSTLIGGVTLSIVSLELEVILVGMGLSLASVLIQYFYFDKRRINDE